MKIAVLGTSCIDRVITPRLSSCFDFSKTTQIVEHEGFGGSMHNIAYHLGLLKTDIRFFTKIGNDHSSRQLVQDLEQAGVKVYAKQVDGPCPVFTCLQDVQRKIYLSSVSEKYFYHYADRLNEEDFKDVQLGITDNHHEGFFQHLMKISPHTKWTMNARQIPLEWLSYLDGYILNRDEALRYGFESLEAFGAYCLNHGLNWLVVTLDKDGLIYFDHDSTQIFPSLTNGEGIALGCGDAFSAGFLYGRSLGVSMQEAIQYGLKAAALIYKKPTAVSKEIVLIQ